MGRGQAQDEALTARPVDPWDVELRFDLYDAQLETALGPLEIEDANVGERALVRLNIRELVVGGRRYRLSALVERDEDGHLAFATFDVSAPSGGRLPRDRFAEAEAELLDIVREWALEHSSI